MQYTVFTTIQISIYSPDDVIIQQTEENLQRGEFCYKKITKEYDFIISPLKQK